MIRCAASTIVCKPDEQKRFTVMPGTETGQPARSAICRAMFHPVAPSGNAQPIKTSSTSTGSSFARSIACRTTCPPSVAPWVMLNAPRHDFASPVRAVETMTASTIERPSFGGKFRQQRRRRPERSVVVGIARQLAHSARHVVEPQRVGVEHRSAAIQRKAVAGQIDEIDVGCAERNALLQNARAFIDEREDQAIDDLIIVN